MCGRDRGPAGDCDPGADLAADGHLGARAGSRDRDRGSATVLVLGLVGALAVLLVAVALLGAVARARGTAQTAADLAALAAARVANDPWASGDPCAVADAVARAHAAELTSCSVTGGVLDVTTAVPVSVTRGADGPMVAEASARAGPVGPAG
ncbi:conserved hypothetical protein [Beutenbergia cavernae DSM 12333]|uniref:Putative Flp pilus-assembly TadG-like N-terminal domain-containing protein n=1 Tax=Beutenbergia cavernae (strain ATCC BAA-8 / DSM 12333 / CCUG 43141 / JCM 11478 / NBRC 16432 / NCIMB 13614 / HKI 0122) TaxID=471853 RepID=C5BXZ2_BEUC1|nr:Rv3654c family TadE-like protein [Beutenbergia cavernae]ACQ78886.1 conserved hypothetical protein [Beutenbergia cavernae DSM 12333]